MKRLSLLLIIVLLLVGCGNKSKEGIKEIKRSDLCVTHIELDENICYGDDKTDVEKIAGLTIDEEPYLSTGYKNGLSIMYRDDKVAAITLYPESLNIYETDFGKLGESKTSIINRLGSAAALHNAPLNLDYFYDSHSQSFMTKELEHRDTHEDLEKVYILSFMFDNDGITNKIMLIDMKMAVYMY